MSTLYMNPYNAQMYPHYLSADTNGPIPLPPCKDAFSLGPAPSQTTTGVRWISHGYNFSDSVYKSKCTLIKDAADFFYYIIAYWDDPDVKIRINVYDAENDDNTVYTITTPAEIADIGTGSDLDFWNWTIRKKSDTQLDFVVRGMADAGATYIYQHYTWTIGDASLAYVNGMTFVVADVGDSYGFVLQGDKIIDMTRNLAGSDDIYLHIYNLDSHSSSSTLYFDSADKMSYVMCMFHAGYEVHFIVFYSAVEATGDCPELFGGTRHPNELVRMYLTDETYRSNGSVGSYGETIAEVSGHDCYIRAINMSYGDDMGATPDGQVYFKLSYSKGWSDAECPDTPYVPGFPGGVDHEESETGYYTIGPLGVGFYDQSSFEPAETSPLGGIGPGRFSFSSRTDPISLIETEAQSYLFHWKTLEQSAAGIFYSDDPAKGTYPTQGSGMRNDAPLILISTAQKPGLNWHNIWLNKDGDEYLDQETTIIAASTNLLPIHGSIGKWPVHHNVGRWAIFDPNIAVTLGPRWQVV